MLYTVISPKEEYYSLYEDMILKYQDIRIDLCIKEYGKKGSHPHMNVIWEDTKLRTDKLTAKLKKYLKDLPDIDSPVLIRTQTITDIVQLIGGYLQKEESCEILINTDVYKLDEMKALCKTFEKPDLKPKKKWQGILSYTDAPLIMVDYCQEHNLDYIEEFCIMDNLGNISATKHDAKRCLRYISKDFYVSVAHLLRKIDDIHQQILFILLDKSTFISYE